MKRSAILTMALAVPAAWAGEDIAGAKDHPLLTRYPDSFITEYTKNYNATEFQVGAREARIEISRGRGVERNSFRPTLTSYSNESRLPLPAICGWKCAMPPCTATSD
jgi:hypothetical protein